MTKHENNQPLPAVCATVSAPVRNARRPRLLRVLPAWLMLAACGTAQAEEMTIRWQMPDFPPTIISSGPQKGTGYAEVFLRYFIAHTPDIKHVIEPSSMSRVFGLMRQGELVCEPSLIKTPERETYVDFSGPVEFVLTHHVVLPVALLPKLAPYRNGKGEVDMSKLVRDPSLTTVRQEKRGYPAPVLTAFEAAAGQKNVIVTSDDGQAAFRQIATGWVSYVVAYADEANWYARQLETPLKLAYVPIAGLPEYTIGYVGCTKSPWGKKVIQRVNEVVAKAGKRPPWIDAEAGFLDPEAAKRFEVIYARHSPFRHHK